MQGVNRKALIQDAVNTRKPLRVPQDFIAALRLTLTLHLDDPSLDVDLVARSSGISRQTLQRRLRSKGTTLSAQIIDLKRQRAQDLLAGHGKNITEIAAAVGFASPTSFTRAFKAWTGVSPRDYRKRHRA